MERRVRVEIRSKDEFWGRAFHVEWEDQHRDRGLEADPEGYFLAEPEWLEDLNRVAAQTFSKVLVAPSSPDRRRWISLLRGRP